MKRPTGVGVVDHIHSACIVGHARTNERKVCWQYSYYRKKCELGLFYSLALESKGGATTAVLVPATAHWVMTSIMMAKMANISVVPAQGGGTGGLGV